MAVWNRILVSLVALPFLLVAPTASALGEPLPSPPMNLQGEYDEKARVVMIDWDAPAEGEHLSYNIYRDGVLVNSTESTSFIETAFTAPGSEPSYALYHVTAVDQGASLLAESASSNPFLVVDSPLCAIVIISVEPDIFPYVHHGVNHACIDGWKRFIDRIIGDIMDLDGGDDLDRMTDPPDGITDLLGPVTDNNIINL